MQGKEGRQGRKDRGGLIIFLKKKKKKKQGGKDRAKGSGPDGKIGAKKCAGKSKTTKSFAAGGGGKRTKIAAEQNAAEKIEKKRLYLKRICRQQVLQKGKTVFFRISEEKESGIKDVAQDTAKDLCYKMDRPYGSRAGRD